MLKRVLLYFLAFISSLLFISCADVKNSTQINSTNKRLTDFSQIITLKDLGDITGYTFLTPADNSKGDSEPIPSDNNTVTTKIYYLISHENIQISVNYYTGDIQKFEKAEKDIKDVQITNWNGVNAYWDDSNSVMSFLVKNYQIGILCNVKDGKGYDNAKQIGKLIFDRISDILK